MRYTRFLVLALLLWGGGLIGAPAHAQSGGESEVPSPDATVYVDGLACPFCAYGLEKKLEQVEAIRAMEVQVEKSRILVAFREGERASEMELRQAVEDAGFTARKIEFSTDAPSG